MRKSVSNRLEKLEQIAREKLRSRINGYPDPVDKNLIWSSKELYDDYEACLFRSFDLLTKEDKAGSKEAAERAVQIRETAIRISSIL